MNIVVYCGNSENGDAVYLESARKVGEWIARNGHTLVYGGCKGGLMGEVADAAADGGAAVIGVMPDIPRLIAKKHDKLAECVFVEDMAARKRKMIELGDAFIALPGGLGTLDEISDVFALIRLGVLSAPTVLFDQGGFYQPLKAFLAQVECAGFMSAGEPWGLLVSEDMEQIACHIQGR